MCTVLSSVPSQLDLATHLIQINEMKDTINLLIYSLKASFSNTECVKLRKKKFV